MEQASFAATAERAGVHEYGSAPDHQHLLRCSDTCTLNFSLHAMAAAA
jgi:hypothetical protein